MKEKPNIAVVEDTEEVRKWRGLSQSRNGTCAGRICLEEWKRKSWKIQGRRKQKRPSEVEVPSWNLGGHAKTRDTENKEVGRRLLGENFLFVQRVQLAASAM